MVIWTAAEASPSLKQQIKPELQVLGPVTDKWKQAEQQQQQQKGVAHFRPQKRGDKHWWSISHLSDRDIS